MEHEWNVLVALHAIAASLALMSFVSFASFWIQQLAVPSRLVPQAFQDSWAAMAGLTLVLVGAGLALVWAFVRIAGRRMVPTEALSS